MRGPIEARIAAIRGQVRCLLALHGLSWLVFSLATAILVAGSADWLIRLAPEVRLALLLGVIGLGSWLAVTRVPTSGPIVASRSSECQLGWRTSNFAAGSDSSSSSCATNVSSGFGHRLR